MSFNRQFSLRLAALILFVLVVFAALLLFDINIDVTVKRKSGPTTLSAVTKNHSKANPQEETLSSVTKTQSEANQQEESLSQPSQDCTSSQEKLRIACIGDSLTLGDGRYDKEAKPPAGQGNYPAYLQEFLRPQNKTLSSNLSPIIEVGNFGRGGATACNVSDLPYIASQQFQDAVKFQPDIVIIMLGTNDAIPVGRPGRSTPATSTGSPSGNRGSNCDRLRKTDHW